MDLTLPQQLYLLSLDPAKGRMDPVSATARGQLLRAAALAELVGGGWLERGKDRAVRTLAPPPGDRFLARVLADIPTVRRHWITVLMTRMGEAEGTVRDDLATAGAITVHSGRALKVLPTRSIALERPAETAALRDRVRAALLGKSTDAAFADVALAAIAAEGDVWTLATSAERAAHRRAVTALRSRFDSVVPDLRVAIRTAVMATGRGAAV